MASARTALVSYSQLLCAEIFLSVMENCSALGDGAVQAEHGVKIRCGGQDLSKDLFSLERRDHWCHERNGRFSDGA